jgi:hypothetical protein
MKKTCIRKIWLIVLVLNLIALSIYVKALEENTAGENPTTPIYKRLCLSYGQSIPSESLKRYTCYSDLCMICVNQFNYPVHLGYCNQLEGCNILGDNTAIDREAPIVSLDSPINNSVYNSRKVLFNISANEPCILYFKDNLALNTKLKKLSNVNHFSQMLSFKDGFNSVTIMAMDRFGNQKEIIRQFYVDSIKPKIKKTLPTKGFADGNFEIYFSETNPKSLTLEYGNLLNGYKSQVADLSKCNNFNGINHCIIDVNLSSYNEQKIEYWFTLKDIGENIIESKPVILEVDTTGPNILNPDSLFKINGKYVYFSINLNETNFEDATYYDYSQIRPKWKPICNRLKNGVLCEKKETFSSGNHVLDIQVNDKAGNAASTRVEFNIS